MGAKKGLKSPIYPAATTSIPGLNQSSPLLAGPTCKDALDDLPEISRLEALMETDEVRTLRWGKPSTYAKQLRCLDPGGWHFGYQRLWNPEILTSSMRTEHSEISRLRFAATKPGEVEPISRFFKLSPDGVSNTLRAGTDSARGAFTSPRPIHYRFPRCITVREMARLHGFPDWFRFHSTKWHGARQVGNAVPPPLARAVASSIIRALGVRTNAPKVKLALGDPALLTMEMSRASAYWGVVSPIQKRDRKGETRKRSQIQTEFDRLLLLHAQ